MTARDQCTLHQAVSCDVINESMLKRHATIGVGSALLEFLFYTTLYFSL